MRYFTVLVFSVLSFNRLPALADTVTLGSVADAEIRQFSGDNFGSSEIMNSGRVGDNVGANSEHRRALVRFDLSTIPSTAIINSASLAITVTTAPPEDVRTDSNFNLRRTLQSWRENEVTWTNRLSPNVTWQTSGATGPTDIAGTVSSTVFITGAGNYSFPTSAGLVSDVQGWVTNAASNFGWLIISENQISLRTARQIGTRENSLAGNRPVLTVNYSLPATPPTISAATKTNGQFSFSFNAESNRTYTVESRASLSVTNWSPLTNFTAALNPTNHVVTDSLSGTTKFYRVKTP